MPNPDAPRRVSARPGARPPAGRAPGGAPAWRSTDSGAAGRQRRTTVVPPPPGGGSGSGGSSGGRGGGGGGKGRRKKGYGFFNYPRKQYTGFHRWVPSWRFVLSSALLLVVLVVGGVLFAYSKVEIPQADQFVTAQKTTVYYDDGKSVMGTFGVQDRVIVNGDDLPEYVRQVFVAAEDRTFYENNGISPKGIARAFVNNLRGGAQQGGSTITQQYAERYYLGTTKSYTGKFKEALLAVKLSQHQDKNEILDNYINTIYFGRGAYGIQSAAQKYFKVDAKDLTLSQAAMIAGIVPSPTNWDPRNGDGPAVKRWNYVLDGMVQLGWLSPAERATQKFPKTIEYTQSNTYGGTRGYLLDMVRGEVVSKAGMTEEELDTRGLSIVTTIDKSMQSAAVQTVKEMPEDTPKRLRESLVSIDPDDGAIKALYGGPNFLKQSYNNATQGAAQAGSTFKPFALIAGLEADKTLYSTFNGNTGRTIEGFERPVTNFNNENYGYISLLKATAYSVNTAYAALNVEIGPENTEKVAVRAGIPQDTTGLNDLPSNVLGTASVHPVDLATAYATIASGGVRHETHIIGSISEISSGDKVYSAPTKGKREFDEDVIANTTYAMQQVVQYGSGTTAKTLDRPIAGKTGTSSDNKSAWFAGFTPSLVTVFGINQVGADGSEESITPFGGYSAITGGSVPVDRWTAYMGVVLDGTPVEEFPKPVSSSPSSTESESPDDEETEEPVEQVAVPSGLVGSSEAAASRQLKKAGLKVAVKRIDSDEAAGTVVSVSPGAGAKVDVGSTVTIVVSKGPGTGTTPTSPPVTTPPPTTPTEPPTTDPTDDPTQDPGDGSDGGGDGGSDGSGGTNPSSGTGGGSGSGTRD